MLKLASIALLLAGVGMAVWSASRLTWESRASGWPTQWGRIVSSVARPAAGSTSAYDVEIVVEFTVDGQTYRSRSYALPERQYPEAEGRELVERHWPGKEVAVRYKPSDPSVAALKIAFPKAAVVTGVVAGFLLVIGIGLVGNAFLMAKP